MANLEMTPELYAAFVAATTILMLIPGPNVAVIAANSLARGSRWGLITVAGTCAAMVPQLALTVLGMSAALDLAGRWFGLLRWAGALYLIWLGIRAWRAPAADSAAAASAASAQTVFVNGFLVSLTNPKTLLFYAAFFPQFVSHDHPARQLWLLAATFLALAALIDSGWALLAARLRFALAGRGRWPARLTGGALILAGVGLAAARRGS
jgi:threonine/homoserine/homoserine lactone efflux protein